MHQGKSVGDVLGTKFGNEKSAKVMERLNRFYHSDSQSEKLGMYLKNILKEEGMTGGRNSVTPPIIYRPAM